MREHRFILGSLALLGLVLAVFSPALRAGFIWDDDEYIIHNRTLIDGSGLVRIWTEPGAVPQYYPLVHTTFWIEHHLWGLRPFGFHLVNLILHALAAILLWRVLRTLQVPAAWWAAAVFAIHPVQVESVAWVTERKNVLSGLLYFAALLAWFRYLPWQEDGRRGSKWFYAGALFLFAAALLSKTVTGSLPAAILLILWWKRGRIPAPAVRPLLPFFGLALAMGLVTIWLERVRVGAQGADWELSFLERVVVAGRALWFYISKLIWPADLSFIYPRWTVESGDVVQFAWPAAAVLAGFGLWRVRRRIGRAPLAAALFFAGTLFPALGFFNVYPMRYTYVADHYQYLAAAGPIAFLCGGIAAWWRRRQERGVVGASGLESREGPTTETGREAPPAGTEQQRSRLWLAGAGTVSGLCLLVALGGLSHARARVYHNLETLWLDTLDKNPGAWMAHHNLGKVYDEMGRTEQAIRCYRAALDVQPDLATTLYNLGSAQARLGRSAEAIMNLEAALRIDPSLYEARSNLGNLLWSVGRREEAVECWHRALAVNPAHLTARRNLAQCLPLLGRDGEAIEQLRAILEIDSEDVESMTRLAWLLARTEDRARNDPQEAVRWGEKACRLSSYRDPRAVVALAEAYERSGRSAEAARLLSRAREQARASGDAAAEALLSGASVGDSVPAPASGP